MGENTVAIRRIITKNGVCINGKFYLFDGIEKYIGAEVEVDIPATMASELNGPLLGKTDSQSKTEAKRIDRLASVQDVVEVLQRLEETCSDWDYRDLVAVLESAANIYFLGTARIRVELLK